MKKIKNENKKNKLQLNHKIKRMNTSDLTSFLPLKNDMLSRKNAFFKKVNTTNKLEIITKRNFDNFMKEGKICFVLLKFSKYNVCYSSNVL